MKRHALPPPRIDEQMERRVGRHVDAADALLVAIAAKLAGAESGTANSGSFVAQYLVLLVAERLVLRRRRRLHGEKAQHLQQVIWITSRIMPVSS